MVLPCPEEGNHLNTSFDKLFYFDKGGQFWLLLLPNILVDMKPIYTQNIRIPAMLAW